MSYTYVTFQGDWDLVLDTVRDKLEKQAGSKKVGNDPIKDQRDYHGIKIDIEWPKGSIRSYKGSDTYVTHMKCAYGYARGIKGNDGEELDIYLGDGDSDTAFIIEQLKEDGSYDEDKVMLGFDCEEDAVDCYLQHMPGYMLGDVRPVPVERLVNALYGEPEDRRGKTAAYSDLVVAAIKAAETNTKVADLLTKCVSSLPAGSTRRPIDVIDGLSRLLIGNSELTKQLESLVGQKVEDTPFTPPRRKRPPPPPSGTLKLKAMKDGKTTILPDGSAFFTGVVETDKNSQEVFDPKINKKTKSDYVGPQTSQVGGIGGVAAEPEDIKASVVWPGDPDDENLNTDPVESYDNRDIDRGRMT